MKLKELRMQHNIKQSDLAKELGCMLTVYARYEREERPIPLDMLIYLSKKYEVSLEYILDLPEPQSASLTEQEQDYLSAFRKADDQARDDAIFFLNRHSVSDNLDSERQRVRYEIKAEN